MERPILFSTSMIQSLLNGSKTRTRRIVKPSAGLQKTWLTQERINQVPHGEIIQEGWQMHHPSADKKINGIHIEHDSPLGWVKCPYGQIGDILWVRETWNTLTAYEEKPDYSVMSVRDFVYKADDNRIDKWKPSIFMPKEACRIRLGITDIRVERLQDISESDAIAEGVYFYGWDDPDQDDYKNYLYDNKNADDWGVMTAKESYMSLWESINGKDSWSLNPWVWVIIFKKL